MRDMLSNPEYEPFFYRAVEPSIFEPSVRCVGPWNPNHQHGGPAIALLGQCFDTYPRQGDRFVSRMAVEILGPIYLESMSVTISVVRSGVRIELLEGFVTQGERVVLRGLCWRFRVGNSVAIPFDEEPTFFSLPTDESLVKFPSATTVPYIESMEWRFVLGSFDVAGNAVLWSRPRVPLVYERPTSQVAKALLMLDSANGASSVLSFNSDLFVPVDMTLSVLRVPEGAWMGMEAKTTIGEHGSGITKTVLFDEHGHVGNTLQTLFVESKH